MFHHRSFRSNVLAALVLCASAAAVPSSQSAARPSGPAYRVVDLDSNRTLEESRADIIDTPVAPGSVFKIATFIAASEAGLIEPSTSIVCRRTLKVAGTSLACVHPDLHRGLTPVDALAYSCNYFFATVASRMPRSALDGVLIRLGLSPTPAGTALVLAADGLGAVRVSPADLLRALTRVAGPGSGFRMREDTRRMLLDGLRASASHGTSSSFGKAGLVALAKTGTAPMPGGGYQGLVVAILPGLTPRLGIVVLVPGGAGSDAAEIAAKIVSQRALLAPRSPAPASPDAVGAQDVQIRVGERLRNGGTHAKSMSLEEYVAAAVAGESEDSMHTASRAALAIAARTFALANLGRHQAEGFDLCDLTHCQALASATPLSRRAARETSGQVLLDAGHPAQVFFSAWCGGHTEKPSSVWPGAADPPFLPAQPDAACATREAWTSEVSAPRLLDALRATGLKGQSVRDVQVTSRTGSGRAERIRVDGLVPGEVSAGDFRQGVDRLLGWQVLKSTMFDVRRSATGYVFVGRGSGHGVGLCLVGADRRAAEGSDAQAILAFYFPGLRVGPRPSSATTRPASRGIQPVAIRVVLPEADLAQLTTTRELAQRLLDEMATRLGVQPPGSLTLRFHPTPLSNRDATGSPWWVAGTTSGGGIDLLPLAVLRRRGILESTLRHELVHVLTNDALAGRPMWVREGLAAYLAGETASTAGPAGPGGTAASSCPADKEFAQGSTPDKLGDAYARAAECVSRQLARGLGWRDLR